MGSFLYFIPDRSAGLSAAEFKATGLWYALDGSVHQQHLLTGGPGGRGGLLLADAVHCDPSHLQYDPVEQDWTQTPSAWLGRWKAESIGPEDLLRHKPLDGHWVELPDEKRWLCPIARSHVIENRSIRWHHTLPRSVTLGPDHRWRPGEVVGRHRRLWEISLAWWDVRAAVASTNPEIGNTVRFDFEGLHSSAAECLTANYRVGPDEISMLGLFDSESARNILDALIDMPSAIALMEELEKKTADPRPVG